MHLESDVRIYGEESTGQQARRDNRTTNDKKHPSAPIVVISTVPTSPLHPSTAEQSHKLDSLESFPSISSSRCVLTCIPILHPVSAPTFPSFNSNIPSSHPPSGSLPPRAHIPSPFPSPSTPPTPHTTPASTVRTLISAAPRSLDHLELQ
ncbi:hypothetical protein VE01_10764 [Pseudogymnoascus verrucosus]|uniref:Uncharacterized protein n=1 Tax=Pseudogymnoascus verrucosus TaxID=342668 RepID=A0A2P6FH60_9PEZI|nr:uncharacterized protein VE01_10764 [Pseudogymnoascus verrucosus]PQM43868.1 hypothetical protein VE01_10764 [Pseudogymnoascus verrucosus]